MSYSLATRPWAGPRRNEVIVGTAALGVAGIAGLALGARTALGLALVSAICCAPVVMSNLALGIAIWVPFAFLGRVPGLGLAGTCLLLLIGFAWVGGLQARRSAGPLLHGQHLLVGVLALLVTWLCLSPLWAQQTSPVGEDLIWWCAGAALIVVVATTIATPDQLRLVLVAFVVGALVSIVLGWSGAVSTLTRATVDPSGHSVMRFEGAAGNPNALAAVLVPAIILAAALVADRRGLFARWTLLVSIVVMTVALAATLSRGGLLAGAVVALVAVVVYKRQRPYILTALALVVTVAGAWFALSPQAWQRVANYDDGGAGRATLWRVAWRIAEDKPVTGAGLNNFRRVAPGYVRDPGSLRYAEQITRQPHVVHNTFLQLLAEAGFVGLGLFLAVVAACLDAGRRAVRKFERAGRGDLARLSRASVLAICGFLAASVFQSTGTDTRLWLLLALGPVLLTMANRCQPATLGA